MKALYTIPVTTEEWVRFIRDCCEPNPPVPLWFSKAALRHFYGGTVISVNVAIEAAMRLWAEQEFESTKRKRGM
jgi:hypothetical protein